MSSSEKKCIVSILEKIENAKKNKEVKIISFDSLFQLFNNDEKILIEKFKNIDPSTYGFKGDYFGIQKVPNNLIAIRNQQYKSHGKIKTIETQYLPRPVYLAYKKLNAALHKDTQKKLLIDSGYRSPAYQVIIFLWYLNFHKFNFLKNIKRVALPGYSEHGFPKQQAVDFITINGIPTDNKPLDFAKTIEYKWLLQNADKFNFYQSYPRNNKLGIMFEPWHWHFRKIND